MHANSFHKLQVLAMLFTRYPKTYNVKLQRVHSYIPPIIIYYPVYRSSLTKYLTKDTEMDESDVLVLGQRNLYSAFGITCVEVAVRVLGTSRKLACCDLDYI